MDWLYPRRMADFAHVLADGLAFIGVACYAWCVLPNHYHLLIKCMDLKRTEQELGQLQGHFATGIESRHPILEYPV